MIGVQYEFSVPRASAAFSLPEVAEINPLIIQSNNAKEVI